MSPSHKNLPATPTATDNLREHESRDTMVKLWLGLLLVALVTAQTAPDAAAPAESTNTAPTVESSPVPTAANATDTEDEISERPLLLSASPMYIEARSDQNLYLSFEVR